MTENTNPVAVPVHQYAEMRPNWNMVDTLWGGTRAMRKAGKKYLPPMTEEPEAAYNARLKQSVLTNYYRDTIEKLVAKPLKQPVVLKDDVPASIEKYRDNIDGQGTDLDVFAKQLGEDSLNHGVSYILVDFPRNNPDATIAEEKANNIRPYAVNYSATQVIGWKTEVRNGKRVLTQVRIAEESYEDTGEFEQAEVHRIRVLEPGFYRLFELREVGEGKQDWVLIDSYEVTVKGVALDFIPLIGVYSNKTGYMTAEPAMMDLADLNVTHWQSDSDQRNILHVARVPILFAAGLGDSEAPVTKLNIGATTFIKGQSGSDLKYVEHNGKGIEAGRQDLQDLESRMSQMGLNMLVKGKSGTATATARVLDQAESDSPLGMFARELEQALAKMLDYFGVFLGLGEDQGGTVAVFTDFSLTMRDAEDIKALGEMRARGDISQLTYWEEMKRRGLLSDEFDAETEVDLLDLEAPNREGLTEAELEQGNMAGDETGEAEGHTHVLQANGWTNLVDGHRHKWEPTGDATGTAGDPPHQHPLGVTPRDPGAVKPQPAAAPNQAAQGGTPSATDTGTPQ